MSNKMVQFLWILEENVYTYKEPEITYLKVFTKYITGEFRDN